MVAVAGPVIGAPLTTILIVFELTRNYDIATAAMVSVAFANLVSYRIVGRSLFDIQLKLRGFDLSLGRDKVIVETKKIESFISSDYLQIAGSMSIQQARQLLLKHQKTEAYITGPRNLYLGKLTIQQTMDLVVSESQTSVDQLDFQSELSLSPDDSIWDAMIKLEDFVGESIPVVKNNQLQGIVFEGTIISAYLQTIHNIRLEENAAG